MLLSTARIGAMVQSHGRTRTNSFGLKGSHGAVPSFFPAPRGEGSPPRLVVGGFRRDVVASDDVGTLLGPALLGKGDLQAFTGQRPHFNGVDHTKTKGPGFTRS